MSYYLDDTIAAIASAPGGAARGMVRVSGPDAVAVVGRCFTPDDGVPLDALRRATQIAGQMRIELAWHAMRDGEGRGENFTTPCAAGLGRATQTLPCDLYLWPSARSYTRQPAAELHTIGSPPVLEAVLAAVCAEGARLAEPGEFTLRAFLAGRIDLTQAEAVLGVIDARGEEELAASLAQLAGGLARPLEHLRDQLLQLLAELEAGLDFVEEDIRFISADELAERLASAAQSLHEVAEQMASRLVATHADQVALVGPPNVGKSSLFNALVARYGEQLAAEQQMSHAALVSPMRGTTRDYLTATIVLDGIRCELVDTAGVDECRAMPIDAASQELSDRQRTRAAIRIWCSDAVDVANPPSDCDVVVLAKADVVRRRKVTSADRSVATPTVITSSHTGAGLDELCGELCRLLGRDLATQNGAVVAMTAERCRESVRLAEISLQRAVELVRDGGGDELVAAEVRGAVNESGKVVGAVYTDDILDRIFSTFCVGK